MPLPVQSAVISSSVTRKALPRAGESSKQGQISHNFFELFLVEQRSPRQFRFCPLTTPRVFRFNLFRSRKSMPEVRSRKGVCNPSQFIISLETSRPAQSCNQQKRPHPTAISPRLPFPEFQTRPTIQVGHEVPHLRCCRLKCNPGHSALPQQPLSDAYRLPLSIGLFAVVPIRKS